MRAFRFGVNLFGQGEDLLAQARAVERSGADVLMVPDHLGLVAPFPALAAMGRETTRLRLGNFVLNAGFSTPELLVRECATTDALVGGRLEIGLGAGYVEDEFTAAGLPFPTPGARVRHLAATVRRLRDALTDPEYQPAPVQSPPPIMIAGVGDKVLSLAAQYADIVAFSNVPDLDTLGERVRFVEQAAGERFSEIELNAIVFAFGVDREPDLTALRMVWPDATDDALMQSVHALCGSLDDVVAKIHLLRERYGVSYFTVLDPGDEGLADLSRVIAAVRS